MNPAARLTAGTIALEPPQADLVEDAFGHDGACRVMGANEQDVQWLRAGHDDHLLRQSTNSSTGWQMRREIAPILAPRSQRDYPPDSARALRFPHSQMRQGGEGALVVG